jgi:RimJ/RimL family protein N-acetyltransferase
MFILESERLILRPPRPSDVPAMAVWLGDYDVAKNTSRVPHPYGEADAEAFLALPSGGNHVFAIQRRGDGLFIGCCGLHPADGHEFGYWLTGWCSLPSRSWGRRPSMPAGFTTIRRRGTFWPSWARAITARKCGNRGPGASGFCAMTCC